MIYLMRSQRSFHFPEMRTNELTVDAGDAITGTGEYTVCAVKLSVASEARSA